MLKFPSILAAMLTGVLWMPLFFWSLQYIERGGVGGLLFVAWGMVGFVLPALFATVDLRYLRNRLRAETTLFGKIRMNRGRTGDYTQLYVPAWIRMGVLFLSTAASVILLKIVGISL